MSVVKNCFNHLTDETVEIAFTANTRMNHSIGNKSIFTLIVGMVDSIIRVHSL